MYSPQSMGSVYLASGTFGDWYVHNVQLVQYIYVLHLRMQKLPGCKKGVTLFKMASVKKL